MQARIAYLPEDGRPGYWWTDPADLDPSLPPATHFRMLALSGLIGRCDVFADVRSVAADGHETWIAYRRRRH